MQHGTKKWWAGEKSRLPLFGADMQIPKYIVQSDQQESVNVVAQFANLIDNPLNAYSWSAIFGFSSAWLTD